MARCAGAIVAGSDFPQAEQELLRGLGVELLADPYEPLVEIEQPAGVGSMEPADSEGGGFAGAEAES
jgi:hypothetical protein